MWLRQLIRCLAVHAVDAEQAKVDTFQAIGTAAEVDNRIATAIGHFNPRKQLVLVLDVRAPILFDRLHVFQQLAPYNRAYFIHSFAL